MSEDTTEKAIIREEEAMRKAYEACRRHHGLLLQGHVPSDFARKLFRVGFIMGSGIREDWKMGHRKRKDSSFRCTSCGHGPLKFIYRRGHDVLCGRCLDPKTAAGQKTMFPRGTVRQ